MEFLGIFIIIITIIIVQTKKNRQKEKFKVALKNHIANFSNRTEYFENIYSMIAEREGVDLAVVDKMLLEIPNHKRQFTLACDELIALSDHNICLFSEEKRRNTDWTPDRLTRDTIEVLPVLGKYFKVYNTLYTNIHTELLVKKFLFSISDKAVGIALSKESDYETKEHYDKSRRAFMKVVDNFYQAEIRNVIRDFLKFPAHIDIETTTNSKVLMLSKLAQEYSQQEDLDTMFLKIWIVKMQEIARRYVAPNTELDQYFNEIQEKMQQYFEDYSVSDMFWLNFRLWAPSLDERTEEECLRVLKLYNEGKLRGAYRGRHSEARSQSNHL